MVHQLFVDCSPDIAPSDVYLIEPLENHLADKQFASNDDLQAAVSSGYRHLTLISSFFLCQDT